jgi:ferredoxin
MAQRGESVDVSARLLTREVFGRLLGALREEGYALIGPTVRDGAIVYDSIGSADDLPVGWTDRQAPGSYRLERRPDGALFGYAVGPHSWKQEFLVPSLQLLRIRRHAQDITFEQPAPPSSRRALIGVRACELAAIDIQDRVLMGGVAVDPDYAARRRGIFVVAVHCSNPSAACFCASMHTGPRASGGFDLALTELTAPGEHRFVAYVGSDAGAALLAKVGAPFATAEDVAAAAEVSARAAQSMDRRVDKERLAAALGVELEHPRWDSVAARCLGCANCTMVCPTCFCTTVRDRSDLAGESAERVREWDSCFTTDFSHLPSGSVRASQRSRYRQWLTHKLSTWIDQFGSSGCVGCGRCITWCPVGIDLTEEASAVAAATVEVHAPGAP